MPDDDLTALIGTPAPIHDDGGESSLTCGRCGLRFAAPGPDWAAVLGAMAGHPCRADPPAEPWTGGPL